MNNLEVYGFTVRWLRLASIWQRLPDNRKIRMFEMLKEKIFFKVNRLMYEQKQRLFRFYFR